MKSNMELFLEKLSTQDSEEFLTMISTGKCNRCSNYYYDANQNKCHKNLNESSCEEGQKEWLESYSDENLQLKYKKKYWECGDSENAENLKRFIDLLYESGVICVECIEGCCSEWNVGRDCVRANHDNIKFINLHVRYEKYVKIEVEKMAEQQKLTKLEIGYGEKEFKHNHPFRWYLKNEIIPKIKDRKVMDETKQLCEKIHTIF